MKRGQKIFLASYRSPKATALKQMTGKADPVPLHQGTSTQLLLRLSTGGTPFTLPRKFGPAETLSLYRAVASFDFTRTGLKIWTSSCMVIKGLPSPSFSDAANKRDFKSANGSQASHIDDLVLLLLCLPPWNGHNNYSRD